jgi:hypothetical protein
MRRPALGLPRAISGHNSYWLWGTDGCSGRVLVGGGGDRDDHQRAFASVKEAEHFVCRDCMPYENNQALWVARQPRRSIAEIWPGTRHFDQMLDARSWMLGDGAQPRGL